MMRKEMFRRNRIFLSVVFLLTLIWLGCSAHAETSADIKLYVFEVGKIAVPDKGMIVAGRGGVSPFIIPVPVFLIEHPKGLVLVDTGMNPDVWPDNRKKEAMFDPKTQRIDKQLAKLGYKPEDIKYVVMTHLHLDHAGWMRLFPKSIFVVRKDELKAAWWPDSWMAWTYLMDDRKGTRDFNFLELDSTEDFDIFMDGTVVCFDTKGHSRGHQSVLVELDKTGTVALTGDALDTMEMLNDTILPGIVWSPEAALKAIKKFQHMQREGAVIFPNHDPDFFKTVKLAPKYYD